MVVAREGQHAAMARSAGGIGMLEDVAAAVDARPLAVPHGEDAVVARLREEVELLAAPDRGGGKVLVDAGLEADVMALEMRARAPQALVEAAERRAAVAGDEARGVEARAHVALALQHHQTDQCLRAGEEHAAALERVLVVQRCGGEGGAVYGGIHLSDSTRCGTTATRDCVPRGGPRVARLGGGTRTDARFCKGRRKIP